MPRRNPPTPPKRRPVTVRCAGKRVFTTKEQAARTAQELQRLHDSDQPHRAYLCTDCGKWHLTSSQS